MRFVHKADRSAPQKSAPPPPPASGGSKNDEAEVVIDKLGLGLIGRPKFDIGDLLELAPSEFADMRSVQLITNLALATQWRNYAGEQYALAKIRWRRADDAKRALAVQKSYLSGVDSKAKKYEKDAAKFNDEEYIDAVQEEQRLDALKTMLEELVGRYERLIFLLSRQLTTVQRPYNESY